FPATFGISEGQAIRQGMGLTVNSHAAVTSVVVDVGLPADGVTGLRLEVNAAQAVMVEGLRIEHGTTPTTNVALGCPVESTPPAAAESPGEFLTDGLSETTVSVAEADTPVAKTFLIDLKRPYALDHLNLRLKRGDLASLVMPSFEIELFDRMPATDVTPVWRSHEHAHQALSMVANTESLLMVKASAGKGRFAGRFLRISAPAHSMAPMKIAEVEAYETIVPLGVTLITKEKTIQAGATLTVPSGASWMTFDIDYPPLADPVILGRHWRIAGFHDNWQSGTSSGVVESRCPPPGEYEFQAQIRHSDDRWCDAMYRVPLTVPVPFWQQAWARGVVLMGAVALTAGLAWFISRRVMAQRVVDLERRNELSNERARIARDMHDAVGSQLTQLAVLHEIVAEELALDDDARRRLRQLTDTARASVAALDAVVWVVNPGNDNLAHMAGYLTQVAREYLVPLGIACRQDVPHEWPERHVDSHTRHELHFAFLEALQNVVKHARASEVTVTMRHESGYFTITLADNGIGLPADLSGMEKNGLDNMHSRLSTLRGHCRVRSRPEGGTVVELQIPLTS
ncbi:MAG: histidine kinase, partial [Prosthecobacter sp.]|nr:histidine kinase [Prosthecobacter sp.]